MGILDNTTKMRKKKEWYSRTCLVGPSISKVIVKTKVLQRSLLTIEILCLMSYYVKRKSPCSEMLRCV